MGVLDEIEKRHRRWIMAGRPGAYDETELLERMERAEYALRSFALWYAARGAPSAAAGPHDDALAIAGAVFDAQQPEPKPFQVAVDRELLLAEVRELWQEVKELRAELGREGGRTEELAELAELARMPDFEPPPGRLGLTAPPPRLIVVSDDGDQPGMHGEGTYP